MTQRYSLSLRRLHWLTVGLVVVQLFLAIANIILYEHRPILAEWLVQAHISCGFLIIALTIWRIIARSRSPIPAKPHSKILSRAAIISHGLLYVCLLTLPITGYLKLAALGFTIFIFGLIPLPTLPLDIHLAQTASALHDSLAIGLLCLLILHIGAALFHRRLDGRSVMTHITIGHD